MFRRAQRATSGGPQRMISMRAMVEVSPQEFPTVFSHRLGQLLTSKPCHLRRTIGQELPLAV